ncbi:STAS domain-containing protein [Lentzea sp. NPDC004782]|uniref:STAS domain-containing protein n=1 Tax=Lentzea sp. NPDC004782 TaxID=3154458 RepID=UPI0033A7FB2D
MTFSLVGEVSPMGELDHDDFQVTVRSSRCDDVQVIGVCGELDHDSLEPLRNALDDAPAAGLSRTVVDLRDVTFFGSSGLNLLIHAHQQAACRGGAIALVATHRAVLRSLGVTGVDRVIGCYSSLSDAVAALRRTPSRMLHESDD